MKRSTLWKWSAHLPRLDWMPGYDQFPEWSRSMIRRWIEAGAIRVDDQTTKPSHSLRVGQKVIIIPPPPSTMDLTPEPMELQILFEDEALLVLNKSPGCVVHPAAGHATGTLVHGVLPYCEGTTQRHWWGGSTGCGASPRPRYQWLSGHGQDGSCPSGLGRTVRPALHPQTIPGHCHASQSVLKAGSMLPLHAIPTTERPWRLSTTVAMPSPISDTSSLLGLMPAICRSTFTPVEPIRFASISSIWVTLSLAMRFTAVRPPSPLLRHRPLPTPPAVACLEIGLHSPHHRRAHRTRGSAPGGFSSDFGITR